MWRQLEGLYPVATPVSTLFLPAIPIEALVEVIRMQTE